MEGVIQLSDSISGSHTHITHIYEYTGKKALNIRFFIVILIGS